MGLLLTMLALSALLWRLRGRQNPHAVSPQWIAALDRQSSRVEYHGPWVHRKWVE